MTNFANQETIHYTLLARSIFYVIIIMYSISGYTKNNSMFYDNDSSKYIAIKHDIDLNGDTIYLPERCILDFKGGALRNGMLIGNDTQVRAQCHTIFHNIDISGSWITPIIYATWFENVRNAIREPFKMLNSKIANTLYVGDGTWELEMPIDEKYAISIPSNSEIVLQGVIRNYSEQPGGFSIFFISNSENVRICGNGKIVGNRDDKSVAKRGSQTGHTITIGESTNVTIEGVTLSYSRGDGILIGETDNYSMPENVVIKNLRILHSRRQGISICAGHNIIIENLYVNDVSGAPQGPCAGIDIENFDNGGVIGNVFIRNVIVTNVSKGLSIYNDSDVTYDDLNISLSGRAESSRIYISNYIATQCNTGLRIGYLTENVLIENSVFEATDMALSVYSDYSQPHDYTHQNCHQINNCKFYSNTKGLKASVDIRSKGFLFNNCTFETFSPFTVHESAIRTSFRDCIFRAEESIRFFNNTSLDGCCISGPSLILAEGGKAINCTINSPITLKGKNSLLNSDVYCQGIISNLVMVEGDGVIISNNHINDYDDALDIEMKTNIKNLVSVNNGHNCVIENNIIGLKNCKIAIFSNIKTKYNYSKLNSYISSLPYSYKDKHGEIQTIDYTNGVIVPD
jgi:hypothetical protein